MTPRSESSATIRSSSPSSIIPRRIWSSHTLVPAAVKAASRSFTDVTLILFVLSRTARARSAIACPLKPKCSYSALAGAEAPNPSMAMTSPSSPTQRCQPSGLAASTETRARTEGGSTLSR